MSIILASASPRRRELMTLAGIDFTVAPTSGDGEPPKCLRPEEYVRELAHRKASEAAKKYPSDTVIGADTIVCENKRIFEKPSDKDDAFNILRHLSGKVHYVYTGVCIICGDECHTADKEVNFFEKTGVAFFDLSDSEILSYIATGEPMDKAGAYGIQGIGALLVKGINGDYCNVVGLPIAKLVRELRRIGAIK